LPNVQRNAIYVEWDQPKIERKHICFIEDLQEKQLT